MDQTKRMPSIYDAPPPTPQEDRTAFIGKKPNKVVLVQPEFRRQTLRSERTVLINDIKVNTGCVVFPNTHDQDRSQIVSFDIFGGGPGVEAAVRHLNDWIPKALAKSARSSAWAKMPAFEYAKEYDESMQRLDNEQRQQFRGPIPTGDKGPFPKHTSTLDWPEKLSDQNRLPRDVFGNKLEKLDALRMQDQVWITLVPYVPGNQWQIDITGYEIPHVAIAKKHIATLIDQLLIDAGVQQALYIILDEREGTNVELQRNEVWWPNHVDKVVPRLVSLIDLDMDQPGSFREQDVDQDMVSTLQESVERQLNHIRFKKGTYDFAVRLGCLALSSKHISEGKVGECLPKKTFCRLIDGKFELDVKKWLADDEVGRLIQNRLMLANDILEPTKPADYGRVPASLDQTRPTLHGTWVFRDPNSAVAPLHSNQQARGETAPQQPTSLVVVQIDWSEDEEGKYEKDSPRFYKLEAGKPGPKKNMDVNMLELGESRGWQFALESMTPLHSKSVSPVLTGFATQVKLKSGYSESSTDSFASWNNTPTVRNHLQAGRLDKTYTYGIKKTCYKVELTAMWYPRQLLPVWGLAVRHSEWANHLAELEDLSLGSKATWEDTISTFFPKDGQSAYYVEDENLAMGQLDINKDGSTKPAPGLQLLVEKLMKISEIVSSNNTEGGIQL